MSDRLAMVTGSSSGIGLALTRQLLARGWYVIGVARRPANAATSYQHVQLDLADVGPGWVTLQRVLESQLQARPCARFALVNNAAAAGQMRGLALLDPTAVAPVVATNVAAPIALMGLFLRLWPAGSALRFLNVSSGAATTAFAGLAEYCSSKAGMRMAGMVASLEAEQWRPGEDVAVLSYEPGIVDTDMQRQARERDAAAFPLAPRFRQLAGAGMLVPAHDVATDMVSFLEADGPRGFSERRYPGSPPALRPDAE